MRVPAALALLASGCFYLDPVNLPPVATIDRPPGPYHVGDAVTLTASASHDDASATLGFSWSCPGCSDPLGGDARFVALLPSHDTVRVTVIVSDEHGATGSASVDLPVTDRDPTLALQVATAPGPAGTYAVGATLAIAAQAGDPDGDMPALTAVVHPPPASDPGHVALAATGAASWSLTPDVPGHWEVAVTADDGFGGTTVATQTLEVAPDGPPCIAATTPAALPDARYLLPTSDGPRRFAVDSVADDLDPWPAAGSQLAFRWFVCQGAPLRVAPPSAEPNGAPACTEVTGHDLPDLTIDPADHAPGDTLALRVEIADRVARALPCAPDQPECSIAGDACLQRVTWTVEVR